MKKYLPILISLLFVALTVISPVFAEETASPTPKSSAEVAAEKAKKEEEKKIKEAERAEKKRLQEEKKAAKEAEKAAKKTAQELVKANAPEKVAERKEKAVERLSAMQIKLKEKEASREAKLALRQEAIASKEAQLKAKLQEFKDKAKADTVARINTNLNKLNQNATTEMSRHLGKMTEILTRLDVKAEEASYSGKTVTDVQAAIASAKDLISATDQIIQAQILKDYSITVNTEATVRQDANAAKEKLLTDLKSIRERMQAVRKAVSGAIEAAVKVAGQI